GLLLFLLPTIFVPQLAHASLTDRLIIRFRNVSSQNRDTIIKQFPVSRKENLRLTNAVALNIPKGQARAYIEKLAGNPNIEYAEEDYVAQALDVPDDQYFVDQWGLQRIQAPFAWDVTHGSANTLIAIVDSGIDGSHPDLENKIVGRANFTTDPDVD